MAAINSIVSLPVREPRAIADAVAAMRGPPPPGAADAIDIERRRPFRCPGMFRSAQRPSKVTGPAIGHSQRFR
jgi:hypothetical protein